MTAITGSSPTRREREFNISWTDVGLFLAPAALPLITQANAKEYYFPDSPF